MSDSQWPLWEVFAQLESGGAHTHVGSLHAADGELALQNARDLFARRWSPTSLWVVPASAIVASQPEDAPSFFDAADDKVYRHPQFYKIPKGMRSE